MFLYQNQNLMALLEAKVRYLSSPKFIYFLFIYLFIRLFIYLFVYLYIRLFIYLFILFCLLCYTLQTSIQQLKKELTW